MSQESLLVHDSLLLVYSISLQCYVSSSYHNEERCLNNIPEPQGRVFFSWFVIALELENFPGLIVLNYTLMHMHQLSACSYLACYSKDIKKYIFGTISSACISL